MQMMAHNEGFVVKPSESHTGSNARRCLVCDRLVQAEDRYAARGSWLYVRCRECGLVFLHTLPDTSALSSFYNESYEVDFDRYLQGIRRRSEKILLDLESRFPQRGKLLEIGSSYGGFLAEAKRRGWNVTGIELSEKSAEYGRSKLGVTICTGRLEDHFAKLKGQFDVVTAFHVIEHVSEPLEFLEKCRGLLRPGGLLFLKTPNIDSIAARMAGPLWQWLDPPAHLYLFSPPTLAALLRRAGLHTDKLETEQGDAHTNLFEAVAFAAKSILSRSGEKAFKEAQVSTSRRITEAVCHFLYLPFQVVVDPLLAAKMLQPELRAWAWNSGGLSGSKGR